MLLLADNTARTNIFRSFVSLVESFSAWRRRFGVALVADNDGVGGREGGRPLLHVNVRCEDTPMRGFLFRK